MKRHVYTFGNQKQADKLEQAVDSERFTVVHIMDEDPVRPGFARNAEDLAELFEEYYRTAQDVAALVSFGRGTVVGGLEAIAKSWEIIKKKHPEITKAKCMGPSYKAAKIFFDKALTYDFLNSMGAPTPRTKLLGRNDPRQIKLEIEQEEFPFPAVIKVTRLSGGQGMKLVPSLEDFEAVYSELLAKEPYDLILSEFLGGPEASFALLRLGDTFLRIPPSYKDQTTLELRHSDSKVKMAGIFKEFESIYQYLETIMRKENISGLFYLQAILQKSPDGEYTYKFIEGETRLTGSSPISFRSLKGFDFHKTLAAWIDSGAINCDYEKQLCVQYASYIHHGESDAAKLLAKDWVIEAKYEKDLTVGNVSGKPVMRIRVSFIGEDRRRLDARLKQIGEILGNPQYGHDVQFVLDFYHQAHPLLVCGPQTKQSPAQ